MIKVPCDKWREREKEAKGERRRDTVAHIYDFGRIAGDVHSRRRCRCRHRRSVCSGPALDLHQSRSARSDQCTFIATLRASDQSSRAVPASRRRLFLSSFTCRSSSCSIRVFTSSHFLNHFFVYHDKTLLLPLR